MKRTMIPGLLVLTICGLFAFRSHSSRFFSKRLFSSGPTGNVYVIVDKSDYGMHVYDDIGWYATYPVVFGNKSLGDKMMEGDRNTPEGTFKIVSKVPNHKWHKFMTLDYPNDESWRKFRRRKAMGVIPPSARIGGGIGIHGTWPNDNIVVDDYTNWTAGCVSLKNSDLDEVYSFMQPGTKVIIRK